ncbi:carbohydrate ABC transporter permease [Mangrovicoccus sp. HB161399]|uniref:carbohydrate ABC transporter permease n=1 Tax=Mangrovicoccus sp. HB161399 TaxID=2720392 RepID=UPI0015538B29|nr:carbohydrate ABC transporter permease [Mangrovicoccus sp. HB161399]
MASMDTSTARLAPKAARAPGSLGTGDILRYALASIFVGFCLFPLYMVLSTSLKAEADIFAFPPAWSFRPIWDNFNDALFVFGGTGVMPFLLNSVIVTAASTAAAVGLGAMVAYGLTRFRIRGGSHLFFFILSTRFAPPVAFVVPLYLMVRQTGLMDTHLALILIYTSMNLSLVVWIIRGFFEAIPVEIEEAAEIDGYSRLQIFFKVALPLVKPGLITTAILSAIMSWNEFLIATVMTQNKAATLPVYLGGFSGSMGLEWGPYMAVGAIAVLPIMIFTLVLQKHLVRGLTFGAVR